MSDTPILRLIRTTPLLFATGQATSALDLAWDLFSSGQFPIWGSILTESQTAGRGRMGRTWQSPPGHVYAALRLPDSPPFDGPSASMSLALLLVLALKRVLDVDIRLKWPNDLIHQGGKAGGLLLENRRGALIAGIGLNLTHPPEHLERETWAPPASALPKASPLKLWSDLVENIILSYNEKFAEMSETDLWPWAEKLLLGLNQMVTIVGPATEPKSSHDPLTGCLLGLAPSGALRLQGPDGLLTVWSGTLILPPQAYGRDET